MISFQERAIAMAAYSPFGVVLDADLLDRYRTAGAAYRCYPAPDRFVEEFDAEAFETWVGCRGVGAFRRGLAISVQGPVAEDPDGRVCGDECLAPLLAEVGIMGPLFRGAGDVAAVHCLGDLSSRIGIGGMRKIMSAIRSEFAVNAGTHCVVELAAEMADAGSLAALREAGFERLRLLGPRLVPAGGSATGGTEAFPRIVQEARAAGFRAVCAHLAVPPRVQPSLDAFVAGLASIVECSFDHITLFDPDVAAVIGPPADVRTDAIAAAIEQLCFAGYVYIGTGCFARAEDVFAVARRRGRLQMSPVGYLLRHDLDLLALGPGGISSIGSVYSQNHRGWRAYRERVDAGQVPVERGLEMSPDDLIRRKVIHSLICHGEVSIESVEIAHLVDFDRYFVRELEELDQLERLGLIQKDAHWISVEPRGRLFVSQICAVFDRHHRHSHPYRGEILS